jgi:hypothetical protein
MNIIWSEPVLDCIVSNLGLFDMYYLSLAHTTFYRFVRNHKNYARYRGFIETLLGPEWKYGPSNYSNEQFSRDYRAEVPKILVGRHLDPVVAVAATKGDTRMLRYWISAAHREYMHYVVFSLAYYNCQELIDQLPDQIRKNSGHAGNDELVQCGLVCRGDISAIKSYMNGSGPKVCYNITFAIIYSTRVAIMYNRLDVVQYLLSILAKPPSDECKSRLIAKAAKNGHLPILLFLVDLFRMDEYPDIQRMVRYFAFERSEWHGNHKLIQRQTMEFLWQKKVLNDDAIYQWALNASCFSTLCTLMETSTDRTWESIAEECSTMDFYNSSVVLFFWDILKMCTVIQNSHLLAIEQFVDQFNDMRNSGLDQWLDSTTASTQNKKRKFVE